MVDTLPERCYALLLSNGQLIHLRRGMAGYEPVTRKDKHVFGDEAKVLRDILNEAAHVTLHQRMAMENGSMFGWDCKASDPATWEKLGIEEDSPVSV